MDENVKLWNRSVEQRLEDALTKKNQGAENFKLEEYRLAGTCYINALRDVIPIMQVDDEHVEAVTRLKAQCYSNLAACQLKLHQHNRVVMNCTKCLQLEPSNTKALYRRACAYLHVEDLENARADITRGLQDSKTFLPLKRELDVKSHKRDQNVAKIMKDFMKS